MPISSTFLTARITATEAQIVAYETAITSLATTGVKSYTLSTGQSQQTVTRRDLEDLQITLDSLYNRLGTLYARRDCTGTVRVKAAW